MTEYYPLLARAVAGMRHAPAAQRQAIYDRARQALLGQLRSMQPPVAEASIERESNALDAAIARVEADLAADGGAGAKPAEPVVAPAGDAAAAGAGPTDTTRVETRPADPKPAQAPPVATATADASAPEPRAAEVRVPPIVVPEPKITPAKDVPAKDMPAKDAPSREAPAKPAAARPARPAADALTRIVAERGPPVPIIRASRSEEPVAEADDPGRVLTPVPSSALPAAPTLQVSTFDDALADAGSDLDRDAAASESDETGEPGREEPLRPQAPRPITRERFNPRALILIAVGLVVVAGIGYAAWRLRDRPEQLARARQAMIAAQQAEQRSAAKISNRADGSAPQPVPIAPVAASAGAAAEPQPASPPADATAPATQGNAAAANPPAASLPAASAAPDDTAAATSNPAPTTTATGGAAPAIAVAQRAAFLVDAPEEANKVKTYVGTVLWTTENATPGTDQPLARTVRADIDIPDAALKLSMVFQKNFEAQFPASHTLELHFSLQPGNTLGSVKQINVPQMRKDDSATGDPLIGLPVTIKDDYFLVGLSRGDATAHNLDLIETRNWFDIPLLLVSNKVAKITFEKGTSGQQAIDSVLQSWQQR